jgi:spore germination protein
MSKLKFGIVTLIAVLIVGGIVFASQVLKQNPSNSTPENPNPGTTAPGNTITPNPNLKYSAWIPDWASPAGLASMQGNAELFDNVSPVWYEVNEDGSLKHKYPSNRRTVMNSARAAGIDLIPTIAMFDHELFSKVLQNQEALDRHVREIIDIVVNEGYDGMDLDYESTKLSDKEKFFEWLGKLSAEFKAKDKKLIFTVLAKWENNTSYKTFRETRQVQDWAEISKLVDEVRIMAYDYTSSKAINPGPIAPLSWIEDVIKYGISVVEPGKLVLGVHLYSYEWWLDADKYKQQTTGNFPSDPLQFVENSDLNLPINPNAARSYTYEVNKQLVTSSGKTPQTINGEQVLRFQRRNPQNGKLEERLLVFIDPAGMKARAELAKRYGLKGLVFWRLGGEEDLFSQL